MSSQTPPARVQQDRASTTLLVDESIHSRKAVMRALYWFTDRYGVSISRAEGGTLSVCFNVKPDAVGIDDLAREFRNALLDAELRLEIGEETAAIRNLIVAKAFAEGELLEDAPVGDWDDPVGLKSKDSSGRG